MKKLSIFLYSMGNGGAERVTSILLWELCKDFDITLVLMCDIVFYDLPKNIKIVFLEKSNIFENGILKFIKLPFLAYRYKRLCLDLKIDISFSLMNRPNYINLIAKIYGLKAKIIISERGTPSKYYGINFQGWISRFLIKKLYPLSNIIIVNSQGNKLDLQKNFFISPDKLKVINNPFDLNKIKKIAQEKIDIIFDSFVFITVGRLDRGKNHQLLIKAMLNVDAKLYIIGDGVLKEKLEKLIRDLKLEKKVYLLGKQKNPYKYLNKADCFVFTSVNEGFPNVLLEAMACELPVISSDCQSGPREILAPNTDIRFQLNKGIEYADYGILTPVNKKAELIEAMQLIKEKIFLRKHYKNQAKIRVLDYKKEIIIKKFKKVLR